MLSHKLISAPCPVIVDSTVVAHFLETALTRPDRLTESPFNLIKADTIPSILAALQNPLKYTLFGLPAYAQTKTTIELSEDEGDTNYYYAVCYRGPDPTFQTFNGLVLMSIAVPDEEPKVFLYSLFHWYDGKDRHASIVMYSPWNEQPYKKLIFSASVKDKKLKEFMGELADAELCLGSKKATLTLYTFTPQ